MAQSRVGLAQMTAVEQALADQIKCDERKKNQNEAARPHGFADTVHHEPRGLVGDFQGVMELMGAEALLARN
jgi:hypothetical protein